MLNTFKSILSWFVFKLTTAVAVEMLETFVYCTVKVVHFTDQISKTVYCIRCVIALLHASMVVSYDIKLFRTGTDRDNGILISLLLLVAETITLKLHKQGSYDRITLLTSKIRPNLLSNPNISVQL